MLRAPQASTTKHTSTSTASSSHGRLAANDRVVSLQEMANASDVTARLRGLAQPLPPANGAVLQAVLDKKCSVRRDAEALRLKRKFKAKDKNALIAAYLKEAQTTLEEAVAPTKDEMPGDLQTMTDELETAEEKIRTRKFDEAVAPLDAAYEAYARWQATQGPAPAAAPAFNPFVSLARDEAEDLYTVTTGDAAIRATSGESPFAKEMGVSVEEAVSDAIANIDITGSISLRNSRHDFQPTSSGYNLQIQLGGSTNYRRGKGDTSSTLVVVDDATWDKLKVDTARLKQVLQAAHQQSFDNSERVALSQ